MELTLLTIIAAAASLRGAPVLNEVVAETPLEAETSVTEEIPFPFSGGQSTKGDFEGGLKHGLPKTFKGSIKKSAVVGEGEEETEESSEETTTDEDKGAVLEDKDNNGIPDVIEDYYDEHIRDQYMFGIGLGSIISFAVSALGWTIYLVKNHGFTKSMKAWSGEVTAKNEEVSSKYSEILDGQTAVLNAQAEKLNKAIDEQNTIINDQRELLNAYRATTADLLASLKDCETELAELSKSGNKIDTLLENVTLLSKTEEFTKSGVSAKIAENAKEVK